MADRTAVLTNYVFCFPAFTSLLAPFRRRSPTSRRVVDFSCSLLLLFPIYCLPMFGQAQIQGRPNWQHNDDGDVDSLNLQSLSVSLQIPVMSKSGAFPFNFSM